MESNQLFVVSLLVFLPFLFATVGLYASPLPADHRRLVPEPQLKPPAVNNLVERRFKFPGLNDMLHEDQDIGHYVGHFKLPRAYDARMFYYFFESRSKTADAPVIAWLNGGVGWSSAVAVFYENGPFRIHPHNLSLSWNEYGWDQESNMIFIDQPIGSGFSYTNDERDFRYSDEDTINDLYDFLQAFFRAHPQHAKNGFYIAGEWYAGHINPALAARITQGNRVKEGIRIKIKGIAIGNGLMNPAIQYQAYADYALGTGLISRIDYDRINKLFPMCEMGIKLCESGEEKACVPSYWLCTNTLVRGVLDVIGNINYHDTRKKCEGSLCYDFSSMEKYMNQATVKATLGVQGLDFTTRNESVVDALLVDHMRNIESTVIDLLNEGVKILAYAGEYSFHLNYLGNWRWVHEMEWSGKKYFVTSPQVRFEVDGEEVGCSKSYGPLTFLKIYEAGDMVAMDQPNAALQMIKRWTQGSLSPPISAY